MIAFVIAIAALGAEPNTVDMADYISEVTEVFRKAESEKNPSKSAQSKIKGLNALNAKYKKSKRQLVMVRSFRDIPEKSLQVVLDAPIEGTAANGLRYEHFFRWNVFAKSPEELKGKAIQVRGIPQVFAGRGPAVFWWGDNDERIAVRLINSTQKIIDR